MDFNQQDESLETDNTNRRYVPGWLKESFDPKFNFATIIAFISLLLSGIILYLNHIQNLKYENITYLQDAMTHQPSIELLDPLDNIKCDIQPLYDTMTVNLTDSIIDLRLYVKIKGKVVFENKGNSIAHVRLILFAKAYSHEALFRNIVLNPNERDTIFRLKDKVNDKFFKSIRLAPFDTLSEPIEIPIGRPYQDSITVLHIFILYQNDMDALFDTYYLLKLKSLQGPLFKVKKELFLTGKVIELKCAVGDIISPSESNINNYIYKMKERDDIISWLDDLWQRDSSNNK